ncbi:hypothetical protein FSP39_010260 [Pinctada imbricata]|uniref:Uncharacterized protein n=1 Tax=Pinctada imbricata TaxID=66713 RepID=A0AA88YLD7_PINIB|nr:hypothetical protein FSP39_010260 [Pinctada imbricata]
MVVVLKKRHFLHGKNLLPLIMRFKEADIEDIEVDSLARLKEEHRLERYTMEELEGEFYSLCGEKVEDFYQLAGKSRSKESSMVLLNMAIHLANEIGAPRDAPLQPLTPNSATTSNRKSATVSAAAGEVQTAVSESGLQRAERAIYAVCQVLTRLGYYLGLGKCSFIPSQNLEYLGLIIDSCKQAFVLPERKILTFSNLRDQILSAPCVDVRSLQSFAGKCISFVLAVPAAKLYTVEVNRCISKGLKNSRLVQIDEYLRAELEHWKFLDTWEGNMPWREERHLQLVLATDASDFKLGASVLLKGDNLKMGDFWERDDSRPIHIKEAQALIKTLTALEGSICYHKVDAFVNNKALVSVWERQGRKDPSLNRVIKELYEITHRNNVDLH